jgi:hypothetical protein
MREAKNLNDTIGIVLVTEVINIQAKFKKIAKETGCPRIFLLKLFSNKNLNPKNNVPIIINISAGIDKSKGSPFINESNGTDMGKKAIRMNI